MLSRFKVYESISKRVRIMTCIYCFKKITKTLSWENVILGYRKKELCLECTHSFVKLITPKCDVCAAESKLNYCADCKEWSKKYNHQDVLIKNYSNYKYNDFAKQYITNWKYRGDFILIEGIRELIDPNLKNKLIELAKTHTIVPIPLSKTRLSERAFNQAALIASLIGEIDETLLSRIDNQKQSKKTKQERINTINNFKVNKKVSGKILLVDDIYTTGATIRQAASLLKENGASEVRSFTFIRS